MTIERYKNWQTEISHGRVKEFEKSENRKTEQLEAQKVLRSAEKHLALRSARARPPHVTDAKPEAKVKGTHGSERTPKNANPLNSGNFPNAVRTTHDLGQIKTEQNLQPGVQKAVAPNLVSATTHHAVAPVTNLRQAPIVPPSGLPSGKSEYVGPNFKRSIPPASPAIEPSGPEIKKQPQGHEVAKPATPQEGLEGHGQVGTLAGLQSGAGVKTATKKGDSDKKEIKEISDSKKKSSAGLRGAPSVYRSDPGRGLEELSNGFGSATTGGEGNLPIAQDVVSQPSLAEVDAGIEIFNPEGKDLGIVLEAAAIYVQYVERRISERRNGTKPDFDSRGVSERIEGDEEIKERVREQMLAGFLKSVYGGTLG